MLSAIEVVKYNLEHKRVNINKSNTQIAYDLKIILLGNSFVGKTSIVRTYIDGKSTDVKLIKPTIGTNFDKIYLEDSQKRIISLSIWDTAGMEKYGAIPDSYYRKVDGIMFVFDINDTKSYFDLAQKFGFIKNMFKDKMPAFILVANKTDQITQDYYSQTDYIKSMTSSLNYKDKVILTSAWTSEGVEHAFDELVKKTKIFADTFVKNPNELKESKELQNNSVNLEADDSKTQETNNNTKKKSCCK